LLRHFIPADPNDEKNNMSNHIIRFNFTTFFLIAKISQKTVNLVVNQNNKYDQYKRNDNFIILLIIA